LEKAAGLKRPLSCPAASSRAVRLQSAPSPHERRPRRNDAVASNPTPRPARRTLAGSGTAVPVISGFRKTPLLGEYEANRNVPFGLVPGLAGSATSRKVRLLWTTPISLRSATRLTKAVPGTWMGSVEVRGVNAPPSFE